jgi:hypothetical protein
MEQETIPGGQERGLYVSVWGAHQTGEPSHTPANEKAPGRAMTVTTRTHKKKTKFPVSENPCDTDHETSSIIVCHLETFFFNTIYIYYPCDVNVLTDKGLDAVEALWYSCRFVTGGQFL